MSAPDAANHRRIASIVLPDLACEIARLDGLLDARQSVPFGVVVTPSDARAQDEKARLSAVDPVAWKCGARPGQSLREASAFVARLHVVELTEERLRQARAAVAEVTLAFGMTASLELESARRRSVSRPHARATAHSARPARSPNIHQPSHQRYPAGTGAGPQDTVWLDISGCARLYGGEDLLCAELTERIAQLGHRTRICIANGPRLAQAIARWTGTSTVVPSNQSAQALGRLPISALPLSPALMAWFGKLGLLRIDDLASLDRSRLAHRLGNDAHDLLEFIAGRDPRPLLAYQPPRHIVESRCFDDPVCGSEPLKFVLRGLLHRATARLAARGEACNIAKLDLIFDRSIAALRDVKSAAAGEYLEHNLDPDTPSANAPHDRERIEQYFSTPVHDEEILLRALAAKLERTRLSAPILSVVLTLDALCGATRTQLELNGAGRLPDENPQAIAGLIAELNAWVGQERVGVLSLGNSHRPEAQSRLVPATPKAPASNTLASTGDRALSLTVSALVPTRLLPSPIQVGALRHGALVQAYRHMYSIEQLRMTHRIDGAHWWSAHPVRRDYAHAWLNRGLDARHEPRSATNRPYIAPRQCSEAWLFVDRSSRRGFLHGWFE